MRTESFLAFARTGNVWKTTYIILWIDIDIVVSNRQEYDVIVGIRVSEFDRVSKE